MPTSVALSPHFESFIREQVEAGRYNNVSEVVRAGLRLLEDQERLNDLKLAELRSAIRAGLDGGVGEDAEKVFTRLETKYKARASGKA
ncbi:type II toxin-antitoxin system ParD family antitoxin [Variovorax sp. J31P179]|uniref:type II toxin-antitoxin system ParD family antitoxin n=1 Tax=Variovorax sp. J31P179 TaxID=3053508 RepID=UPI00257688DC|nr:type II toxin-antitoxin system ParD family antitoxin [Variovorax sp. J31P179]MDM0079841.1 type II toxin-antitoxin system ParD family antitoxin [Variovorax sp. J31P179]HET7835460.1 type II toxin-antitoxin system ParD family antitoxin [Variovorax sp.]